MRTSTKIKRILETSTAIGISITDGQWHIAVISHNKRSNYTGKSLSAAVTLALKEHQKINPDKPINQLTVKLFI
jgi:hypothetical protein